MNFRDGVARIVTACPSGRVMTYGQVAAILGAPRAARAVGTALHWGADDGVPWWRVINAEGRISTRCPDHTMTWQRALLEAEGVAFGPDDAIDLRVYRWWPDDATMGQLIVSVHALDLLEQAFPGERRPYQAPRRTAARRTRPIPPRP